MTVSRIGNLGPFSGWAVWRGFVVAELFGRSGKRAKIAAMSLTTKLIYMRNRRGLRRVSRLVLGLRGVEVPGSVTVGDGLVVHHRAFGTVIHPRTTLGERVTLYHGVTIGDGTPWADAAGHMRRVVIGDDVVLCPGAKIICPADAELTVGRGTVIGANAVLTRSTGDYEIWAGAPARRVGTRASC